MTLQRLVLFAHLLGAVLLLAGSFYGPLMRAAIRRTDDVSALRGWLRYARDAARANPPAALVVLLSGVYLGRGRWSEAWLVVAVIVFVVSSILSLAAVEATLRRIEKVAANVADGRIGEPLERLRASAAWELGVDALLANDLALLFLMVQQPSLAGSIGVVLLFNGTALGYWSLRRRRAPAAAPAAAR